ncbi:hypothetical protein BOX15_Mlig018437g1 [Macrostomum lignano]|uniref:Dystroglycan C-terminal domain-containing protein n=1 Tax=Macrostomum lignano TaxID=282301 RepID=A0A267DSK2_9PLAT|nr:hypothetical protein BOX15_Mlig018437g1 [Macrostomum lignano]
MPLECTPWNSYWKAIAAAIITEIYSDYTIIICKVIILLIPLCRIIQLILAEEAAINKNAAGGSNDVETASIGDSNVLLITVAPACGLVLLALLVALLVACCLYKRKPANSRGGQQQQQQRSRHVSYQQQQQQQQQYHNASLSRHGGDFSLTSKHVPIIFAEELEERPSAPSKPLILPNEKPPLPPPDIDGYGEQDELLMERTPLNPQQQQQQLLLLQQQQQQQQQFATLGRTNNGHGVNGSGTSGSMYRTLPSQQLQQQQQQQQLYHQQQQNPGVLYAHYANQG